MKGEGELVISEAWRGRGQPVNSLKRRRVLWERDDVQKRDFNGNFCAESKKVIGSEKEVEVERVDAERILPEEIWETILKQISERDLLWKLSLTCQLFQNVIIKPGKNVWLFTEIFPILFPYVNREEVLKIRGICKGWRDVVDNHFENHPSYKPHDEKTHNPKKPMWKAEVNPRREKDIGWYTFTIGEHEDPTIGNNTILREMKKHPTNPFIGRKLDVDVWCKPGHPEIPEGGYTASQMERVQKDMFGELCELLNSLGEHVWDTNFYSGGSENSPTKMDAARSICHHFTSRKLLHYLPNLRSLRMDEDAWDVRDYEGSENSEEADNDSDYQLKLVSAGYHYPSLPNLEHIDVGDWHSTRLERELTLRYHSQLKYLKIRHTTLLDWKNLPNMEWPNLTELHLAVGDLCDETSEALDLEKLTKLKAPNLKKIGFCPVLLLPMHYNRIMQLLHDLRRGMPQLSILRLELTSAAVLHKEGFESQPPHPRNRLVMSAPEICAPEWVKTLEIDTMDYIPVHYFHSLMRRFRFINNLNILLFRTDVANECKSVNKYLDEDNPYACPLWWTMPTLNIVTLGKKVFTRRDHMLYILRKRGCVDKKL